jgi:hypothetical protein
MPYRQAVEVNLEFTPRWLPWVEPEGDGLSPGPVDWFVTLGRNRPTERWPVARSP